MIGAPLSPEEAAIAAASLDQKVSQHVLLILDVMERKLGRPPSLSELTKWGELYQLVGAALLAHVESTGASAPTVEAPPVDAAPPVAAPSPSASTPSKRAKARHRGPAPQFQRSHKAGAPPTNHDPIPPGGMGRSAPAVTAEEVLSKRPAKPPQRRRVVDVEAES